MSEQLPRVWVGRSSGMNYWGWCHDTQTWNQWDAMEGTEIFVPGNQPRPTIDPREMDTIATCKVVDW